MPFPNPDPNNAIERYSTTVSVYTHDPDGSVGDSVYYDDEFDAPVEADVSIRADEEPRRFNLTRDGQTDEGGERYVMDVPKSTHEEVVAIETDDSVDFDGRAWRLTERQYAARNEFYRYVLVPDNRRAPPPE